MNQSPLTHPSCQVPTPATATSARRARLGRGLPALVLISAAILACGLPDLPLPDPGESFFGAIGTMPPMPTFPAMEFDPGDFAPTFNLPSLPEGTLQPLIAAPPAWWYLVPVHSSAYAAGSIGRDYHYLVAQPPETLRAYYEQAMRRGGWEPFMDTVTAGSYSRMVYDRGDVEATIYIAPQDGGSLVSIIID